MSSPFPDSEPFDFAAAHAGARTVNPDPVAYATEGWFWVVKNRADASLDPVYSSGDAAYMAEDDSRYTDWTAAGNVATLINTDGELTSVLAKIGRTGPSVLNTGPTDWGGCTPSDMVAAMQAAGVKLTCTSDPSLDAHYQLSGPYDTMMRTQIYINAHGTLPNNQPVNWPAYDKTVTFADGAAFTKIYQGLQDYYASFQSWVASGGTAPAWGTWSIA